MNCKHEDVSTFRFSDGSTSSKCRTCGHLWRYGNRKVKATVTNAPCSAACWHAQEEICHCSCGGKHHGIGYNPADAPQPKEATL